MLVLETRMLSVLNNVLIIAYLHSVLRVRPTYRHWCLSSRNDHWIHITGFRHTQRFTKL